MNSKTTCAIIAVAVLSVMLAPIALSGSVFANKPTSFQTCEKQVGNGGTTEGACQQNNKNFQTGTCTIHVKGKSGQSTETGQCPT